MKIDPIAECAQCQRPFVRRNTMHRVCSPRCAVKSVKAQKVAERADTKRRKEAVKTRKELTAEAQKAFNAYVRLRDHGRPCICCGAAMNWVSDKPGGEIDAGHYLSIGSAPELRFDGANVHAQRKSCNRPGGAKREAFRSHMLLRIGYAELARLEGPNPPTKHTADDLRAIRDDYRARLRAMK
jgi:hypothetical protein